MIKAMVDGKEVAVGDWVGFKSDIEQSGRIVEIKPSRTLGRHMILVLENKSGFNGEYIGGNTITEVFASDCWVE